MKTTTSAALHDGEKLLCTGKLTAVNALADAGILPVKTERNAYNPKYHVWFFVPTPETERIIAEHKRGGAQK